MGKDICLSWRLKKENQEHKDYIEILEKHKDYGFNTMTAMVAKALSEYANNHKLADDKYSSIL